MATPNDAARQCAASPSSTAFTASTASYSECLAAIVAGKPRRGIVHSVFSTAANILFPGDFVVSLNADQSPRMPNGVYITGLPFASLRPGMSVVLGAYRLSIQPLDIVLDLSCASRWNPHIERPPNLAMTTVESNRERLKQYTANWQTPIGYRPLETHFTTIGEMARTLCGRGMGLTPSGDDMLLGWMALGWLLKGPQPAFLAACQRIMAIARQQTHLLSRCWLGYAADGNVAAPIRALLYALTIEDDPQLLRATQHVLAMGATSGYDVIKGILLGLKMGHL